jgi:hypothetical protein
MLSIDTFPANLRRTFATHHKDRIRMKRLLRLALLVLLASGCALHGGRPGIVREVGRPGESYPELTGDGAWSWFGDPRAVTFEGKRLRTYVGWVDSDGDIEVAAYDHKTGKVETTTLHDKLQCDDHASPAILIRPDGRILVFYSAHRGRWMMCRASARSEDISEWRKETAPGPHASDVRGYTYPNAAELAGEGGRLYLFWRGPSYRPGFTVSDDGGRTWSAETILVDNGDQRPYAKYESDGVATIHIAFTDANPEEGPSTGVYYACYRDGALWRADGSRIKDTTDLPLLPSEADRVYDPASLGAAAWIWDIAIDRSGNPVIVYAVFKTLTDHRYRYARWNGTTWEDHEVTPAGSWFPKGAESFKQFSPYYSGGIALDHQDPSVVYLSRPTNGVFEIERWATTDVGATWETEAVTAGSARDNVRPCVPRGRAAGGPELLWMNGTYVSYVDFWTSLRMR